jgi:hypothetical protein
LIHQGPDGISYWGNLDWRLLPVGDKSAALRTLASERGATHATAVQSCATEDVQNGKKTKVVRRYSAGFHVAPEGQAKAKRAHSFAAGFAQWAREHPDALLYVSIPGDPAPGNPPERYAVVVVINGMPVLDKVEDQAIQAYGLVANYLQSHPDISVFADDPERFPRTLMSEGLLEGIYATCAKSKATSIAAIPVDVVKLSLITVVILGALGGYHFHKKHQAEEARKAAMLKAQQEDPVNLYLTGLSEVASRAGLSQATLLKSVEQASKLPVKPEGWNLSKVACDMGTSCEALYVRTTGTFDDLRAVIDDLRDALPSLKLAPPNGTDLNAAGVTWDPQWETVGIDPGTPLQPLQEFVQRASGTQLQNWLVAGLGLQMQAPMLWPQVTGVPNSLKHARAVASGKVEVANVSLPLVREVITKAPAGVIWTGWTMSVGEEKQDILQRVLLKLGGNYYVQN